MSFSTCSCVLWQKEQRSGSSGVYFFTCVRASPPAQPPETLDTILGRFFPRVKEKVQALPSIRNACGFLSASGSAGQRQILPVLVDDLIDHPVFLGLLRIHDV